ncbi:hypothetical protein C8R46DRAFT_1034895 [Mycena filopes]|nr:hypothetical protein C8R46DRAFT_1034895 [Mycena filopes]
MSEPTTSPAKSRINSVNWGSAMPRLVISSINGDFYGVLTRLQPAVIQDLKRKLAAATEENLKLTEALAKQAVIQTLSKELKHLKAANQVAEGAFNDPSSTRAESQSIESHSSESDAMHACDSGDSSSFPLQSLALPGQKYDRGQSQSLTHESVSHAPVPYMSFLESLRDTSPPPSGEHEANGTQHAYGQRLMNLTGDAKSPSPLRGLGTPPPKCEILVDFESLTHESVSHAPVPYMSFLESLRDTSPPPSGQHEANGTQHAYGQRLMNLTDELEIADVAGILTQNDAGPANYDLSGARHANPPIFPLDMNDDVSTFRPSLPPAPHVPAVLKPFQVNNASASSSSHEFRFHMPSGEASTAIPAQPSYYQSDASLLKRAQDAKRRRDASNAKLNMGIMLACLTLLVGVANFLYYNYKLGSVHQGIWIPTGDTHPETYHSTERGGDMTGASIRNKQALDAGLRLEL